jgi:hypothetical protein
VRTLVQPPPPSTHCDLCGGELRLKLVESANHTPDLEDNAKRKGESRSKTATNKFKLGQTVFCNRQSSIVMPRAARMR